MTTRSSVPTRLAQSWPPDAWNEMTVVLAVSGGPDSVALLRAMHASKASGPGRLIVAHVNHGLRGVESDADEQFVRDASRELDLTCEVRRLQPKEEMGQGMTLAPEEWARQSRYAFLSACAARLGARYVATAHTADDQAETILHHILRGTGLAGLSGIGRARLLAEDVTLIRPLLEFRREELLAYLAEIGQPFRVDSSNFDPRYTRNRIRHELLPLLAEQFNPEIREALIRLGSLAGEAQTVIAAIVDKLSERSVRRCPPAEVTIDCRMLAGEPRYLVRELLISVWRTEGWPQQAMGFAKWEELAQLALCDSSPDATRRTLPGGVIARKQGGQLTLTRPAA